MFETLQAQIGAAITALVCAFALWKGERPEKLGGVGIALSWVASAALQDWPFRSGPQYGIFGADVLYLGFSLWLALSTGRLWALFAAAFQLLVVMTHVSMIVDLRIEQYGFLSAYLVWSYLIVAAIALGTVQAMRRRARRAPGPG